ncbi:hypothetical protein J437_LFUL014911 [Ladona fulva]|uniref:DNA mismatch repair proteins mutS family domain-containing protein n=1 Tax=Ladona fulva TaxID=123851 RepID=A0A8K0P582_LADFU|nr:hypothetical protein J437_LFUL014911 [Ladona fulva]
MKTLLNFSSSLVHDEKETNDLDSYPARKLFCLPGKDFYFEPCKRRVLSLQLPGEVRRMSDEERFNYLHSIIDMTAETMVQALGALLLYLDRSWAELTLQPGSRTPPILAINALSLEDMVTIDSVSYEALQIFSQKSHPSNFKKWAPGSSKEGLSVYGIFNRCKSQLGCNRLREIFLHPCRDLKTLKQRQDVIDFCIKGRNIDVVKNFLDYLKHITSVTTIYNCILIGELCSGYTKEAEIFQKINDHATEDLQKIAHYIFRVMDFEQSEAQNKFVVRMGVDEELDKLKQKHLGLSTFMSKVAEEELENLPPEVKECSLMYLPEIGYILCLPMWKDNMEDCDFDIPGLEFKASKDIVIYTFRLFKANRMAHYKSERCKELDSALGDCSVQVMAYELKIMVKLIEFILEHLSPVVKIVNLAAQLDCLISLAMIARENGYVRPELIRDERVIEIQGGRHPLQELCMESFVPNDTYLGQKEGWGCMKILTGPNASGKSVYLKQVALITFLAHIGSFVPAISAKIGIIDSIFTRIRTTESVSIHLSAFMIDLCQTLDHMFEENQIIYLYKLKNGCVKSSFAHQVAESIGIDEKIISRSKQTLVALEEVKPLRGASVEKTRSMFKQNVRILEDLKKENFDEHAAEELLLKQRDLLKHL